jgi:hypothetical protein
MSSISYFFELYDDDNDGKVDREGILRISEALLFLSRRGLSSPTSSVVEADIGPDGQPRNKDEQFLGAVSAFIRRCFEYADPDHPSRQAEKDTAEDLDKFALGDDDEEDEEEDLMNLEDDEEKTDDPLSEEKNTEVTSPSAADDSMLARPSENTFGQTEKPHAAAANAALDPASPVHITLPTFRMLVLADETLEYFFDSGFANSFHLADAPLPSSTVTSQSLLGQTQQSLLGAGAPKDAVPALSPGGAGAGVVPPGKGLRGMLDNIVTDGMRVASEVRRRMDEAQKEIDKGASTRGTEDESDDDEEEGVGDLLDGADALAGSSGRKVSGAGDRAENVLESPVSKGKEKEKELPLPPPPSADESVSKDTMFER